MINPSGLECAVGPENNGPILNFVLLCDFTPNTAGTILDHISGIVDISRHNYMVINFRGKLPSDLELDQYDGLILHYSLVACSDHYLHPLARINIRNFSGIKLIFVQDDYRFIDDTVDAITAMKMGALLGLAGKEIIDDVYSPNKLPGVRRETVLAGYVPEHLLNRKVPKFEDRELDVGYRARKLPAWLGTHGQEKWVIAEKFTKAAEEFGLKCDISWNESDRIYGNDWLEFVANSKAMLGAESGSGVCDFTGSIQKQVDAHVLEHPKVAFEELRSRYFESEDGRFPMNVISPRCFEAAAMRTLMIMYDGKYSGRLTAGRHYLVLDRDHGNMKEVVAVLRNTEKSKIIIDNAYNEVAMNPDNWFRAMVAFLDEIIDERYHTKYISNGVDASADSDVRRIKANQNRGMVKTGYLINKQPFDPNLIGYTYRGLDQLVSVTGFIIELLPVAAREPIRRPLRKVYFKFLKRDAALGHANRLGRIPANLYFMEVIFRPNRWRELGALYKSSNTGSVRIKDFFQSVSLAAGIRQLNSAITAVFLVNDVELNMIYDDTRDAIVFVACYAGAEYNPDQMKKLNFDELISEIQNETVTVKQIIWEPFGLTGISRNFPFTGSYEVENLTGVLKTFALQVFVSLKRKYDDALTNSNN